MLAGLALGFVVAFALYRQMYPSLTSPDCNVPTGDLLSRQHQEQQQQQGGGSHEHEHETLLMPASEQLGRAAGEGSQRRAGGDVELLAQPGRGTGLLLSA